MQQDDPIQLIFSKHGLRCTRQRVAIYKALQATRTHPTADELYKDVSSQVEGMSLATVYNTLEALCAAGLVQKLHGAGHNGSARFDANPANHVHLRCHKSGSVADLPDDVAERLLAKLPQSVIDEVRDLYGFDIQQVQIEFVGEFEDPGIAQNLHHAAQQRLAERVQGMGI